jgi:exosortase
MSGDHFSQSSERQRRWVLALLGVALVVYAYGIFKTCAVGIVPVSLVGWLVKFWGRGGEYAHGYVVPIISAGMFAWLMRSNPTPLVARSNRAGLGVILLAGLLYWIGVRAAVPHVVAGSLVVLVFGLVLYLAGWGWAKRLWFPCAFLIFMIPLNFLEPYISFPLRLFVGSLATNLLSGVGLDVYYRGTGIYSASGRFPPLDVADPCSGIRSLVALMALAALYGYLTMSQPWKKWVVFLSSIPLAVIGNLARIATVALVAQGFGSEWAMKIYHDYSGYIVFSMAILCMIALSVALNLRYRDIWHHWVHEEVRPIPR